MDGLWVDYGWIMGGLWGRERCEAIYIVTAHGDEEETNGGGGGWLGGVGVAGWLAGWLKIASIYDIEE